MVAKVNVLNPVAGCERDGRDGVCVDYRSDLPAVNGSRLRAGVDVHCG